ncbi:ABC transporter permease [Fodinicurvata sp. EGI_FJ10296]|uniref:ABC transporter permease n=1 Tax=Fodinicurvata sp. EGI_FJ10296 TaxID=3231908 RepID=UPI003454B657
MKSIPIPSLKLTLAFVRLELMDVVRHPAYLFPTAVLPLMLFVFFGVPNAGTPAEAGFMLGSFSVFAVLGVAFHQFGVGIAQDRATPWQRYLRTLPASPVSQFVARIAAAILVAAVGVTILAVVAVATTPLAFSLGQWVLLAAALTLGAVPFAVAGIALGYWTSAKSAIAMANVIYLPLSYLGGLWVPPMDLPAFVQQISIFMPSRMVAELVWPIPFGFPVGWYPFAGLAVFFFLFSLLAWWGYAREEQRQFR